MRTASRALALDICAIISSGSISEKYGRNCCTQMQMTESAIGCAASYIYTSSDWKAYREKNFSGRRRKSPHESCNFSCCATLEKRFRRTTGIRYQYDCVMTIKKKVNMMTAVAQCTCVHNLPDATTLEERIWLPDKFCSNVHVVMPK